MKKKCFYSIIFFFLFYCLYNQAVQAEDDVCLNDTTPPTILNTRDFIYEIGQPYPNLLQGVVIEDNCIHYQYEVSDELVDYTKEGKYPIYYYAGDQAGNATSKSVFVYVFEDITDPIIHDLQNINIEYGQTLTDDFFLNGITATDNYDGDVTNLIEVDYSRVNPLVLGTYPVTYTVIDSHSNETIESIIVTVLDTTSPEITGYQDYTVEVFTDSIDYLSGVTATDLYDGVVIITVDDTLVNLDKVGKYSVYLSAVDSHGNQTEIEISVNVVDTKGPEITGYQDYTVEVFTEIIDYLNGVTATDLYDGAVAITINDSEVNLNAVGIYTVYLIASDENENITTVEIMVTVEDTTSPEITGFQDYTVEVFTPSIDYLNGVSANDLYDGELNITVDDTLVKLDVLGTYLVLLEAIDTSGNKTSVEIVVTVEDTTSPVLMGYQDYIVEVFTESFDYLTGVSANDLYDGVLEVQVKSSNVDLNTVGAYEVVLGAVDSSGNEIEEKIDVNVVDTTAPEFKAFQDMFLYEINTDIPNYLAPLLVEDNYDGIISTENIFVFDAYIDYEQDGIYPLIYIATDVSGNSSSITAYVKVYDENTPQLSVPKEFVIALTSDEVDLLEGVTARDNLFGDITNHIIVDDHLVVYHEVGVYPLRYIATDISGNTSILYSTVKIVEDLEAPEILGETEYTIEVGTENINYLNHLVIKDDFTQNILIQVDDSEVLVDTLGTYTVYVHATDNNQNVTTKELTIHIVDTQAPVISGYQDFTVELGTETLDYLNEVIAIDQFEGEKEVTYDDSLVRLDKIGQYEVSLSTIDSSGNSSSVTIQVHVVDTQAPIIHVQDINITLNDTSIIYTDFITISDNDTVAPNLMIDDSAVDLTKVGLYPITIQCIDASGNTTRLNHIITVGDSSLVVEVFTPNLDYLEVLNLDNITLDIEIDEENVNLNVVGTYGITITFSDTNGYEQTKEITVTVIDTIDPVIYNAVNLEIPIHTEHYDYTKGVFAYDTYDGILSITVDSSNVDYSTLGNYEVVLRASDGSGNETSAIITVSVVDQIAPVLYNIKDRTIEVHSTSFDFLGTIYATDNHDDNSEIIIDKESVDLDTVGSYQVAVIASDSSDNSVVKYYTLHVVDTTKPVITGYQDITIKENDTFKPLKGISVTDNYDSLTLSDIHVSNEFDITKPGVYKVILTVSDSHMNETEVMYNLIVEQEKQNEIILISVIGVGLLSLGGFMIIKRK